MDKIKFEVGKTYLARYEDNADKIPVKVLKICGSTLELKGPDFTTLFYKSMDESGKTEEAETMYKSLYVKADWLA